MKPRTTCPDCDAALTPIALRDATLIANPISPLRYELSGVKPEWWGMKPIAGEIHAFMCPECGLVRFYAEPKPPKT